MLLVSLSSPIRTIIVRKKNYKHLCIKKVSHASTLYHYTSVIHIYIFTSLPKIENKTNIKINNKKTTF